MSNPNSLNKAILSIFGLLPQENMDGVDIEVRPGKLPKVVIHYDDVKIPTARYTLVKLPPQNSNETIPES